MVEVVLRLVMGLASLACLVFVGKMPIEIFRGVRLSGERVVCDDCGKLLSPRDLTTLANDRRICGKCLHQKMEEIFDSAARSLGTAPGMLARSLLDQINEVDANSISFADAHHGWAVGRKDRF